MKNFRRLLAFAVILAVFCGTVTAVAAEDILLSGSQTEFTITVRVPAPASAYASADIDVVIDDSTALDIKKDFDNKPAVSFAGGITGSVAAPRTSGSRVSYLVGYLSADGDNGLSGALDALTITFDYNGTEPQVITVGNIRLHRYTGDSERGIPQYSHETLDLEYIYNIKRDVGGTTDPGAGSPGVPGTDANTGSALVPGGVQADAGGPDSDEDSGEKLSDASTIPGGVADGTDGYAPFINGYEDGTVRPDAQLSRAELAQIIYNLYGEGETYGMPDYNDVSEAHWACNPIGFCQEKGYLIGYTDGGFKPERTLTRAELSTAFVRINELPLSAERPFADTVGHWANEYIGAAYGAEYIVGYPDGTFGADNEITRAEAVTIICRALGRNAELYDTDKAFTDLERTHWSYNYLMNAANGYKA